MSPGKASDTIDGINLPGKDNPPPSRPRLRAWLAGLPHRIGAWLHRPDDTEAGWWHWQVTELRGGFARSYRDVRFDALRPGESFAGQES